MILDAIVAAKRKEVAARRAKLSDYKAMARNAPAPRPFTIARQSAIGIIAEVKRATPRLPDLAPHLDAAAQARLYEEAGARAVSCLTDEPFFKTSLDDLAAVRRAVALPVLRKDFLIDDFQLYESRARLADAVLLIVRLIERGQLRDFLGLAADLHLAALVEVHSEKDMDAALDARAPVIGVNNRDLDTLKTSLETSLRLRPLIPAGVTAVTESGIATREDMKLLDGAGFDAALIGETLLKARDPKRTIAGLLS